MSAYRPDYLFQAVIDSKSYLSEDLQDGLLIGVGKRSHAGLSLLDDTDSSIGGFCVILSRDLVAHERSPSFTYGRPAES